MKPGITARLALAILLFLVAATTEAGTLKGVARDRKGATIPYVSVFVPGTSIGTVANADGVFQLNLPAGNYTIACQSLGYKQTSYQQSVSGDEVIVHNFVLQDEGLSLKEVVVTSGNREDPAYAIIRKAIKQRTFHLKQVRAFQSGIYLKGVLRSVSVPDHILGIKVDKADVGADSSGKGVMYLLEEEAHYYAQQPDKQKTVVHSVRQSGNSNGLGFAQMPSVITFYENNVVIMDEVTPRGLVSPISDNALNFYKYKLEGEFVENGQIISKIRVTPRRQFEPVFEGIIYIADGDWAIHSLDLRATEKAGLAFLESLRIEQQFVALRKDTWVVQKQVFYPAFNLLGFGLAGNFVTVYNGQKVNEPVPDSIFNKKIVSTYDKGANKKDTAYWNNNRPIPLEQDEVKDFHEKDSVASVPKDERRQDSLRRRANRHVGLLDVLYSGKTFVGRKSRQVFRFEGLILATNYNTVEGLNMAPSFSYSRRIDSAGSRVLALRLQPRYGFENRHFNLMGGLTYTRKDPEWLSRGWTAGIEGGKYVFQYNAENPVEPILNTISTLLYNQNYLKIYERWDATAYFRRNMGNGFTWNVRAGFQRRIPLQNTSTYSWAKDKEDPITDNVPKELQGQYWETHNAVLLHAGISYRPGTRYVLYPDFKSPVSSNWPLFSLSYDKGVSGLLDSKVNFDKWRFGIEGEQRLKLFGVLSYDLSAGGFLNNNTVAIPDMKHLFGNEYFISSRYLHSFQIAPYYKFSNTEKIYGEAHVEYNMYGMLTNKIPLFRRLNWYFLLGNNTFYAGADKYYTEAFLSIDNIGYKIYRVLRVDFVHSWESNGGNRTGIRIGLRTQDMLGSTKGRNGQW